ncbi:MAG: rubredoxin [Candidatus Obscuribacterales bacterium]|nr:rubredoxin [Candidatus Obscuribacterales bacterium]
MNNQRLVEYDSFLCDCCRAYGYNELFGDAQLNIPAKTHVADLPENWRCPVCDADRTNLRASTMVDGFSYEGKKI